MIDPSPWNQFWEDNARRDVSDSVFDRGSRPRARDIEEMSTQEIIDFIAPDAADVLLDAGCGTGNNLVLLHSKVSRLIGLDLAAGAMDRCQRRLREHGLTEPKLVRGRVSALPLAPASVDKIICFSVFHYLDDDELRRTLKEFARVLRARGVVVLHVKNLASVYLSILLTAKRVKRLFGHRKAIEHFRTYNRYAAELGAAGFEIIDYVSFNVLVVGFMPQRLVSLLQRLELAHRTNRFFRLPLIRRSGADLKLRARLRGDLESPTNSLQRYVHSSHIRGR